MSSASERLRPRTTYRGGLLPWTTLGDSVPKILSFVEFKKILKLYYAPRGFSLEATAQVGDTGHRTTNFEVRIGLYAFPFRKYD